MTARGAIVEPFGDAAVVIVPADVSDLGLAGRVHDLAAAVRNAVGDEPGYGEPVPAAASVLVPVDPIEPGAERAVERLTSAIQAASGPASGVVPGAARRGPTTLTASATADPAPGLAPRPAPGRVIELPTRYGGPGGPDLDEVAALAGRSPAEVVELHAGAIYTVEFLGFSPGFGYLGSLPDPIVVPRLATPRARIAAGSVGIAGRQTAVYPSATPGGWRIIGRTETRVWDPRRDPPALFRPGDRVRFVPVR